MRASRGLKWENKMYKLKRSIQTFSARMFRLCARVRLWPHHLCERLLALLEAHLKTLTAYLPIVLESFAKVSPDTEEQWRSNLRKSIIYDYIEVTV